jgi:peptidyl-prolyl cis-trans isomerase D
MISWIQNTFQRHFRVIFFTLLAVLIVSFVFTIGAAPGIGQAEGRTLARTFYGVNLGSPDESDRLFGDAQLSIVLQAGYQPFNDSQMQSYALQRHAGLHLANNLNLPGPSRDELTTFIQGLPMFAGVDGQFDPQTYARFRDSLRTNPRLTEGTLARVLSDDFRFDRVQKLLGGPGYVLDSDVTQQLERADTSWQINIATLDYTSFATNLQPTDAELKLFFENNGFRYEIPPQVRVDYIEFPAAAFADRVNVSDAEVRAFYDSNPARFPNPSRANAPIPAIDEDDTSEADFAAVRPQVEAELRLERARRLAAQTASDLTVALFEDRADAASVEAAVRARGRTLQPAQPFSRNAPPRFLGTAQNTAEAFRLGPSRPISDALVTPQGAVVLVWRENLDARPAEYAAVQEQVKQDYLENQRRQRFVAAGRQLRDRISARLANGETFAAAAAAEAAAQNVKLATASHGPFSRREPPSEVPFSALNTLERLEAGQISEMVMAGDEGILVHAANKSRPEISTDHERFTEVRTQMAQFNAGRNADDILREMVQTELARSEPSR